MKLSAYFIFYVAICSAIYQIRGDSHNVGRITKIHCVVHDPVTIKNTSCSVKVQNRTFSLATVRFTPIGVFTNVTINLQVWLKASIKYRPFVLNTTEDYCEFFTKNKASFIMRIFYRMIQGFTNFNHTCPFRGEIILKDLYFDASMLPSVWPNGEYRTDVNIMSNRKKKIDIQVYGEIKEIK